MKSRHWKIGYARTIYVSSFVEALKVSSRLRAKGVQVTIDPSVYFLFHWESPCKTSTET